MSLKTRLTTNIAVTLCCASAFLACKGLERENSVSPYIDMPLVTVANPGRATIGQIAPDFTLMDHEGNMVSLSDFRGFPVVLEWFNPQCPATRDAHLGGALQTMAEDCAGSGTIFLAINSGAEGRLGHGMDKNSAYHERWGMTYPILFDERGDVGRKYQARKTPSMYVIDENGYLVYRGALDNAPEGIVKGGGEYINFVERALNEMAAGESVSTWKTKAYGCNVQYAPQN